MDLATPSFFNLKLLVYQFFLQLSPTMSLIPPVSGPGGETAWAAREGLHERDGEPAAHRGDGERDVTFRPDGRRRGAGSPGVGQGFRLVRGRSGAEGGKRSARR